MNELNNDDAFLRLSQIIPNMIPISKGCWYAGIKEGKYPAPIKLAHRVSVWRRSEIQALIRNGV